MRIKRNLAALACALSILTGPALAAGGEYSDVTAGDWFAPAAQEMAEKGIMTGMADGRFAPYEVVDRATVVTVLWRLAGSPAATVTNPFSDTVGTWYETAAAWAKGKGIATGYANGSFGGGDAVTREQLAAFLYRYAYQMGQPLADGTLGLFSDSAAVSDWAKTAVSHAVGAGILLGSDKGTLEPQGIANRAALASMLQRMLIPAAG